MARGVPHTTPTSSPIMPETGDGGKGLRCTRLMVGRAWEIGVKLLILHTRP
jgi:hypothetical protein